MVEKRGRYLPLSLPRRWMGDLLHFSAGVPLVAAERTFRVRSLADARREVERPPSWNAIIIKAIGLVSTRVPEMRRAYLPYPWPRLYEATHSVASVVFDREFAGEPATFMVPLERPEERPLDDIQTLVEAYKTDPIERHGGLRRPVRYARMPRPIRRLIWSTGLQWSGYQRARHFGTFGVNSIAALRGRMLMFQFPLTSAFYYGAVSRGTIDIQIAFDHRVFDGVVAGRVGGLLEDVLNTELVTEVRAGQRRLAA
jgi:hypothetical protein